MLLAPHTAKYQKMPCVLVPVQECHALCGLANHNHTHSLFPFFMYLIFCLSVSFRPSPSPFSSLHSLSLVFSLSTSVNACSIQ